MSTRQYIGARYVIKVYENSQNANSAEWEANTYYEPLTMVTYNNSSYLSKKDVPVTVGNPAQNPSYWVITGAYNGQIATLQSQVQQLTNEVNLTLDRLSGKKIQIFGDSISVPGTWVDDFTNKLDGIATVTNDSVSGRRMFELYAALEAYTTINADIVIVFVGTNDFGTGADLGTYGTDYTLLYSNCIRGVYNQIKSKAHTDCEIFFITPLNRTDVTLNARHYNIDCYRRSMVEFCKHVGCAWINGETFPNFNRSHFPQYSTDGLHPNAAYYSIMSNHIINKLIEGGDNCDVMPQSEYNMADCWYGTLDDGGYIRCFMKTNEIVFRLYRDYNPASGNVFKLTDGLGSLIAGDYLYKAGRTYCSANYTNWGNIFANASNEIYVYDGDTPQTQTALKRRFCGELTFKPNWCNPTF